MNDRTDEDSDGRFPDWLAVLPDPTIEELREIFFREHGGEGGRMP